MRFDELEELHYITRIENLPSIFELGILSHNAVSQIAHISVAMGAIQERRESRPIPGGMALHDYANLYFHARNPMMYKRRAQHTSMCVLSISPEVLNIDQVVITDRNASSDYRRCAASPEGLENVDRNATYAVDWTDQDYAKFSEKRSRKCAEVLVPTSISTDYFQKIYVSTPESAENIRVINDTITVQINADLFFS